jgi:hypothetical protein
MVCRVATSMCRLLFNPPRASDALLFMTILSTDIDVLKRRGYNGDSVFTHVLVLDLKAFRCSGQDLTAPEKFTT